MKNRTKAIAVAALAVALSSCSTSPKSEIAALQTSLAAVESLATLYAKLPLCERSPAPCADRQVLVQLRLHDSAAFAAVMAARYDESDQRLALLAAAAVGGFRAYLLEYFRP